MSKIRIKNFGPIKEGFDSADGFMDIKKVTVFIGDQGTGKSTVAKLISTLTWMEKALNRGEITKEGLNNFNKFQNICNHEGIRNYILSNTEIEYSGDAYSINIKSYKPPSIEKNKIFNYVVPKIMYVPSERNFLTTLRGAYGVTGLPEHLTTFGEELKRAQIELDGMQLDLPIGNYAYEYDEYKDVSNVIGMDHRVNLLEASSGLQSLIPLYLVSRNLALSIANPSDKNTVNISVNQLIRRNNEIADITLNSLLSQEEKDRKISEAYAKYNNRCFINIVEEPEQNLFPTSQKRILESLVEFANMNDGNKLIITTHSPYIINYLSISIQAHHLNDKIHDYASTPKVIDLLDRLDAIVPSKSKIAADDVAIYELKDGKITCLPTTEGIPSDKNYLNQSLAEGNRLFDSLLEIEEDI